MEDLNELWGINEDITPLEIAARAAVMFLIALLLIRISGMRPFGKENAFDTIIVFLIGGILSRGVVGATPFFSTITGAITIVIVHRLLSKFSIYNFSFERTVKGESTLLYKNGAFQFENMNKAGLTREDVFEELRLELHTSRLDIVDEVYMEKTGEISFVLKE